MFGENSYIIDLPNPHFSIYCKRDDETQYDLQIERLGDYFGHWTTDDYGVFNLFIDKLETLDPNERDNKYVCHNTF